MFQCDLCGSTVPASTPCNRIVVETREIEYPRRDRAHWQPPVPPATKGKWVDDPGGHGTAITREVNACPDCAERAASSQRASPARDP